MKENANVYTKHKKIFSRIRLHLVFYAKFRKKIFHLKGAESVFRKALMEECEKMGVALLDAECMNEWVHLYVECPPDITPSNIMTSIKRATSAALKKEVLMKGEHASVWTWDGIIADDTTFRPSDIDEFLLDQKMSTGRTEREDREVLC